MSYVSSEELRNAIERIALIEKPNQLQLDLTEEEYKKIQDSIYKEIMWALEEAIRRNE